MTSIDKLSRSFDFLKIPTQLYDADQRRQDVRQIAKKDKITHLNLIYDNIVSTNVRHAEEWTKMVSFAIEAYLVYFDDEDQDVYFVADECLNKTIKTLLDSNLIRLQYDLYRFMRRNGAERSLRGALVRFAELSYLMKSHKCRMFVELLMKENILSKIAIRPEESIQSVLVGVMSKICSAFCWSMTDAEVISLIQSFMVNLSNDSSVNSYRRVSANCLSIICLFSHSPFRFFYYLHEELLKLVLPLDDNNKNMFTIWGVFICFRFMIIHLSELDKSSSCKSSVQHHQSQDLSNNNNNKTISHQKKTPKTQFFSFINLCEIYELCIYYLNSEDNRILNAALECLQVLLKHLPFRFDMFLTQTGFLPSTFLNKYSSNKKSTDSLDTLRQQISNEQPATSSKVEQQVANQLDDEPVDFPFKKSMPFLMDALYTDSDVPCVHLIRFLSFRFLLNVSNSENKLKSDTQIKVLLKAIAFECCSSILTLAPHLLFLTLSNNSSPSNEDTDSSTIYIYDLIDFVFHRDDKMRINACILIGQLINVVLVENDGKYDEWLAKMIRAQFEGIKPDANRAYDALQLEVLLNHLIRFIKSDNDTNNMCKRYALNALHACLPTLLQTRYASYALNIILNLIHLRHSTYNLVKCELVDLISSLDFKTVNYIESLLPSDKYLINLTENQTQKSFSVKNTQETIIEHVFIYLLGSEDGKLRLETAKSLVRFISNMNFYEATSTNACGTSIQKALMSLGEHATKVDGYARNTFSSSLIDNDQFNLNSLNLIQANNGNKFRQSSHSCSPLSSLSCGSSLPSVSKSNNVFNNNFIQPFHSLIKYWPSNASITNSIQTNLNHLIEHNLNYVVPILVQTLLQSVDKNQLIGCLESLDLIFQTYSPALFYSNNQQLIQLLNLASSYLRHPLVSFDMYLTDILNRFIGNLYCSYAWLNMKRLDKLVQQLNYTLNSISNNSSGSLVQASSATLSTIQNLIDTLTSSTKPLIYQQCQAEVATGLTYMYPLCFNDSSFKQSTDKLFVHSMRMLCVISCVLDESSLPISLTSNLAAGSTAVNTSNISIINLTPNSTIQQQTDPKQAAKFISKETSMNNTKTNRQSINQSTQSIQTDENTTSLPKTTTNVYIGNFQNTSVYLKIYEVAKSSYNAYKKSPNVGNYDKFLQLVKSTLNMFAQLVESALSVHELGPHLDEILLYFRIIFSIEPSCSVKCVTLCLKSLFNLNLAGLMNEYVQQQLTNASNLYSSINSALINSTANSDTISVNSASGPLTSALSSSLTSLTSYSNQTLSMIPVQSKREKSSSILATIVTNQLNQFTRYMYTQSLVLKSDNLNILQMNPSIDLGHFSNQLANFSSLPVTSTSSSTSAQSSVTTVSRVSSFSANPFNFFSMIRNKGKEAATTSSQQIQKELQQQKLKQQKTDHKTITQYIKSFETIVIKSLRQYTFTTSVNLQTRILELLTQLIYLKVDYSLLDSDKVFFEYVLKQFDHLEQKRSSESASTKSDPNDLEDSDGTNLIAKSYAFDLYENFDCESMLADPLNPFDLDTMINKMCATLNSSLSSTLGATGSTKTALNSVVGFSSSTPVHTTPILSCLSLKQQEHQRNHLLIPKLFDFLILLSHEKKNSTPQKLQTTTPVSSPPKLLPNGLLTIPQVMQLCEHLIASENSPHTHVIPALRPLVIDLFLNRTTEDTKELDIQQDVLIKSMLRLIQYPQIWSLLYITVLKYKRDTQNEDKYRKVSRHICDAIFDSMRSNLHQFKLRFKEFNGYESRATRRYSRSYISWIESMKQMFLLLGALAPQVFRPIDFIILSLFEISRPYLVKKSDLNTNEINNWLCAIMVHLFLLLSHCNEEQILIRLYHLMPEINNLYNGTNTNNATTEIMRNRAASLTSSIGTSTTRSTAPTTRSASPVTSSASSSVSEPSEDNLKRSKHTQNKSNYLNFKSNADYDHDLSEAAIYLAKFLLKIVDKVFSHLNASIKFNSASFFSSNLSASSTSTLLRDFQINSARDLNNTQHLLANYLLFLMYMLNIGCFNKIAFSLSNLISDKNEDASKKANEDETNETLSESLNNKLTISKDLETKNEIEIGSQSASRSSLSSLNTANEFNFDSSQFACKLNRIVLFKMSKTNPLLASMWQYFLVLANYQDIEYWSASVENLNNIKAFSSRLASPNEPDLVDPFNLDSYNASQANSLNHQSNVDLQQSNDLKFKIKSRLNYNHKHNMPRDDEYSSISGLDNSKLILPLKGNYIYHSTLNEQLFKYASIAIYCENLSIRNQLDNTTGLTMLLISSLIELFELATHESNVIDLFSSIHRNAYASSLFIHCVNSNWSSLVAKRKLYLFHSSLKAMEGVHLSASGNLLNLVIDKYFHLPYLSLVRYADHIACQRIEMMLSLTTDDLLLQLSEEQIHTLNKYFLDFKYSFRHKRLISLLEQLQSSLNEITTTASNEFSLESPTRTDLIDFSMKPSPSIDFFQLYVNNNSSVDKTLNLDKEWYYNIVRSACCNSTNKPKGTLEDLSSPLVDHDSLKSKQCALILANLDYPNAMSILSASDFKLAILKDCIELGAKRTELTIQKLPTPLKQAAIDLNLQKDFMHQLWLASTSLLFNLLDQFCSVLPRPPVNITQSNLDIYEAKLNDLSQQYDFENHLAPIIESINAYLRCIRQYPSLLNQLTNEKISSLITFILFQLDFFCLLSIKKDKESTFHYLNESLLCLFNLLIDTKLLNAFCQRENYSTSVSQIIKNFYQLLMSYFFAAIDENLICTPILTNENIDYENFQNHDLLFSLKTLQTLLKLRFLITNHRMINNMPSSQDMDTNKSANLMIYSTSTSTHRYLQNQTHYFRNKIPFNMRDLVEKLFLSLCRLPVLDRFMRIPDSLWNLSKFKLEYSQFMSNDTSTLPPLDCLRDPLILKEHLRHILSVGWTSRTQFEYEYVNLLTLLHNLSDESFIQATSNEADAEKQRKFSEGLPTEEIRERNKCICLVVKGLSSWLVKSTLTPKSGSLLNSLYEQVSRSKVPQFLHCQLGCQYSQVKRIIETFSRPNLYAKLNSVSLANNINLLHMLDPIVIDEMQQNHVRQALDFTQPQPTVDALANLVQVSMNLNERDYNVIFSTNIERVMIANLPSNTDSYFYFTQISLEGYLKFLGLWHKNQLKQQQNQTTTASSIAQSFTNFVTGANIDETVASKTTTALNNIIKVAEFFSDDTDLLGGETNKNTISTPSSAPVSQLIQRSFNRNNLDITSVLRTVLDYYESFFRQPCPQLKLEIFKSMLYLGNSLFDSKQQYESLINKLATNFDWLNAFIQQDYDDQSVMPLVNELIDDSILATGIYADSLCRCCLYTSKNETQLSTKYFERLNKMFENGFRSNSLAIKIATCHGIIYWLEAVTLGFINNNDAKLITDHLCKQITQMKGITIITSNARFISSLWSAVFYAIENCLDSIRDAQTFVSLFIKQTYSILNDPNTPYFLFHQLYMGLERFLLSSMIPSFEVNSIQRLLTSKFYDDNKSLCLTSLTITSLYAENQSKHVNYWNDIINHNANLSHKESSSEQTSPTHQENPIESVRRDYPQILELSNHPDLQTHLLKVLEVATNFLDRMKLSATTKEASIYAKLLPKILCDFLPPHDLLNKLITEFLNSSQHPYPEAVAYVLFKCFDLLQEKGLQSQIQEWCLLSLTSFLQRTSIYESIWLSSCLLVSATQNSWLKSTFPFLLNRYCCFETIDRAIFYMSVIEFRKQFNDKSQLNTIYATFESVAKPNTPYAELIKLISSNVSN